MTSAASVAAVAFAIFQSWPAWAIVTAALAPWIPCMVGEIGWTRRHYGWLALFYVLVLTQGGHVGEHVVQMVQIHLLHRMGPSARGVFGALDIEWVHFVWNTWVIVAVAMLVGRFRSNRWLWVTLVIAGWHEAEHVYILQKYLETGMPGTPGLLAKGGAIGGGLPISRPDLHFFYNIVETTPLFIAFVYQLRRTYDSWLATAFPRVAPEMLVDASHRARPARFGPGKVIVSEGDMSKSAFVVVQGEVEVLRDGKRGPRRLATLGPGQIFGEVGLLKTGTRSATVRATTAAEVLELDTQLIRDLVEGSPETEADLKRLARERTKTR
jgi:hypothetical protein